MNIFEKIVKAFQNDFPEVVERIKAPSYTVTNFGERRDYNRLLDSTNYLEQYFGWTYKAVDTVANGIIPYKPILKQKKGGEWIKVEEEESQLLRDLEWFNPYMDYNEARHYRTVHLRLAGLAYWYMCPADVSGHRKEFYPIDPTRVTLRTDQSGLPEAYVFRDIQGQQHDILPEDIIVFKYADPRNWLRGYSPLQASRLSHNTWELAYEMNMNMFGNMNRPEGILAFDGISEKARKRIEEGFRKKYGGRKKAGKTGIMNFVPTWIPLTITNKEMEYEAGIKNLREDILAFQGVPKPLVGLTDSTFTNAKESLGIFQMYTLQPELVKEEGVYNKQLIDKYFGGIRSTTDLKFFAQDCIEEDATIVTVNTVNLYNAGIIKKNEARERVGFDPDDDPEADEYKQTNNPFNMVSTPDEEKKLNSPSSTKGVAKTLTEEQINELKGIFQKVIKVDDERFTDTTKRFFLDQGNRISGDVAEKSIVVQFDMKSEIQLTIDYFEDAYLEQAMRSNNVANELTNGTVTLTDKSKRQLRKRLERFSKEINNTTYEDLLRIMETANEEGWGTTMTRDAITKLFVGYGFPQDKKLFSRAETIARTETTGISNYVYRDNYSRNEAVTMYGWLNAGDSYVRPTHEAVMPVPKGEKFNVGGQMLSYPGDPKGSADEVINCRCVLYALLKGE